MSNAIVPPRFLEAITTIATLLGIVLGFDAIAQSMVDGKPVAWAVFGLVAAVLSALSVAERVFDVFGNPEKDGERAQRIIGGGTATVMFFVFAAMWGFFRIAMS